MQVREIMHHLVHTVGTEATLEQAARTMRDTKVAFLPVVEVADLVDNQASPEQVEDIGFVPEVARELVVGVLTDRDIVLRGVAAGRDPKTTLVSDIMTSPVPVCREDDDVSVAADIMRSKHVRRLFALNRDGRAVAVLSADDICVADPGLSEDARRAIMG